MKHEKKVLPTYFQKILEGSKTFELRLADWDCAEWDILVLLERDPNSQAYTGRKIEKQITCIVKTKQVHFWTDEDIEKYGFQILGFK